MAQQTLTPTQVSDLAGNQAAYDIYAQNNMIPTGFSMDPATQQVMLNGTAFTPQSLPSNGGGSVYDPTTGVTATPIDGQPGQYSYSNMPNQYGFDGGTYNSASGLMTDPASGKTMSPAEWDLMSGRSGQSGWFDAVKTFVSQNKNELIAGGIKAAGAGVLEYLKTRQWERANSNLLNQKYALEQQAKNAEVKRASTMPKLASMINPNAAPQPGLLGQVVRR